MGVIRKQGISTSLLIYFGFALGAFNILVLFARYLSQEQAGLIFLFVAVGKIVLGFASFGNTSIMNKFFPYYKTYLRKDENDFLTVSIILPVLGILLSTLFLNLAEGLVLQKTLEKSPLFASYYHWIIPYSALLILYTALETYSYTNYKTEVPSFLREVVLRLITSLLVILLFFKVLSFSGLVAAYSLIYLVLILSLLFYLKSHDLLRFQFSFSKVTRRLKGKMLLFGSYIYGGLIISALAENADTFFIGSLAGLGSVAVYQTGHFISTIIQVPYRSLSAIAAPVISQAWKDKDLNLIQDIYKKTAINQLLAALLLFGGIWVNIDFILEVLGENYEGVKEVVLLLGIARIIDLGFGQNAEILHNSKYWKFNFLSYVILVLTFLPTNYFLIKAYGIQGSAISNLASFTLFNLVRYVFLWVKFGFQPFNMKNLWSLIFAALSVFLSSQLGLTGSIWLNLFLQSAGFFLLFSALVLGFGLSEDVNLLLKQSWNRILKK